MEDRGLCRSPLHVEQTNPLVTQIHEQTCTEIVEEKEEAPQFRFANATESTLAQPAAKLIAALTSIPHCTEAVPPAGNGTPLPPPSGGVVVGANGTVAPPNGMKDSVSCTVL